MLRLLLVIAALATLTLPALARELPARTPGLWEFATTTDQTGPAARRLNRVVKKCISAALDQEWWLRDLGGFSKKEIYDPCPPALIRSREGTITSENICRFGRFNYNTQITVRGDFARDYTTIMIVHVEDAGEPTFRLAPRQHTVTTVARYLGACAADQRPGDLIDRDGKIIHLLSE